MGCLLEMPVEAIKTEHVPKERIGNKADVANFFGVSLTTVDQWLRRGCPYTQRGERGKQWQFDFLAVAIWKYGAADVDLADDPEKMPPKERLDWYRGTRERTRHLEEVGQLLPAADFERVLADVLKTVAVTLESLPDVLERDAGIDGAAVERCQLVVDRMRDELFARLTTDA